VLLVLPFLEGYILLQVKVPTLVAKNATRMGHPAGGFERPRTSRGASSKANTRSPFDSPSLRRSGSLRAGSRLRSGQALSKTEVVKKLFFRPFGAGSFPISTQGLRPGLHSCAASRL
jgi:hypothetical protein